MFQQKELTPRVSRQYRYDLQGAEAVQDNSYMA